MELDLKYTLKTITLVSKCGPEGRPSRSRPMTSNDLLVGKVGPSRPEEMKSNDLLGPGVCPSRPQAMKSNDLLVGNVGPR